MIYLRCYSDFFIFDFRRCGDAMACWHPLNTPLLTGQTDGRTDARPLHYAFRYTRPAY